MFKYIVLILLLVPATASAFSRQYIMSYLLEDKRLDKQYVEAFLDRVKLQKRVISTSKRKPLKWYQYKRLFVNKKHIELGKRFVLSHKRMLSKVERRFHVNRYILAAIFGIETYYGLYKPKYSVADALYTLSVESKRASYFLHELRSFLVYTKMNGIDPFSVKGSYAGAIGMAQFMPDSILNYGIDFDEDNRIDLVNSVYDAIASMANFLHAHGWEYHRPTAVEIKWWCVIKLKKTYAGTIGCCLSSLLKRRDYRKRVRLLKFEEKNGFRQWACFKNFFVLMRYNPSRNYALSAILLAEAIKKATIKGRRKR